MLGLGEEKEEIRQALLDLAQIGLDALTLGQYLQPSSEYTPIDRWVTPDEFAQWKDEALEMGIKVVESDPWFVLPTMRKNNRKNLPTKRATPHRSSDPFDHISLFPIFQTAFSVLMTSPRNRYGGCEGSLLQIIFRKELERCSSLEHKGFARFVRQVNSSSRMQKRSRATPRDSLHPLQLPAFGIQATNHSTVRRHEKKFSTVLVPNQNGG